VNHRPLLERQLLFVTGKGGVGKTTIAAALAELAARRGLRTLVCEMDAKGALAGAFDVPLLTFEPREIRPNLFAMAMNTEDSLREYLRLFVRIPLVGRIGPLARTFDFVADAAPGVKEILAVGKLCYEARERHYDLVVVDAEASGHVVAQVGAPQAIRDLVQVGLVRDQTDWMIEILGNPDRTGLVAVTTPEEMPVIETLALLDRLRAHTVVHPSAVIANRVLPSIFAPDEERLFDRIDTAGPRAVLAARLGRHLPTVLDATALALARHRTGVQHLTHLGLGLPPGLPMLVVPELFSRAGGPRVVSRVADALADEEV
jgi:anion-transporting  ArsA/GET3 family ATPase